ncbi:MAG TPA: hypothetical protein EYP56_04705 [Planctomycetaceae bacterium]|nr:hypothetical protein [Planctomycetaceae bacterium]
MKRSPSCLLFVFACTVAMPTAALRGLEPPGRRGRTQALDARRLGDAQSARAARPAVPQIEEPWWRVAGNPDLGELAGPNQEPVDFAIWQAADSTWQLWSCIRKTREPGHSRLFYRWEGRSLTEPNWRPMGIAMHADPRLGEQPGGLQAPYVIRADGRYYMFYGDWENICMAASDDGKRFERLRIRGRGPQLFGEGPGNKTRDPMALRIRDLWYCYYSAHGGEGGIFVRTSRDLLDWSTSRPRKVAAGGKAGAKWWNAECPHVVARDGSYYLFRTSRYTNPPTTTVYRSHDPVSFGVHDDSRIVSTLPVAAPEIILHNGQYYIASLTPTLNGIRIARLKWEPKSIVGGAKLH